MTLVHPSELDMLRANLPGDIETYMTPDVIGKHVADLADHVADRVAGNIATTSVVTVLPEAARLTGDLCARLGERTPVHLGFVAITIHSQGPGGHLIDPRQTAVDPWYFEDKDVLFVYTRVRSGSTAEYLAKNAEERGARSVAHLALIHHATTGNTRRKRDFVPDYAATVVGTDLTIFGYGIPRLTGTNASRNDSHSFAHVSGIYTYTPPQNAETP